MNLSEFRRIGFSGKVLSKEEQKKISGGLRNLRKHPGEEEDCVPQHFPYGQDGRAYFGCN
nr:hypothetical protein [uncultured Allomuricauda sp.]